jgi:oligo-1,6-glucosidase
MPTLLGGVLNPIPTMTKIAASGARLQCHHAAQINTRFARGFVAPKPDDSHTSPTWDPSAGALLGEPFQVATRRARFATSWNKRSPRARNVRYDPDVKYFSVCAAALVFHLGLGSAAAQPVQPVNGYQPAWWKEAVVYRIFPRSFQDTNGDGIGDLNGVTKRLDYLRSLGVNVIWLSPHDHSPTSDSLFDPRDPQKIMKSFGTLADFDRLMAAVKFRHMHLIVDLEGSHTSDESRWFADSRSSKTDPLRDYYIWRNGRPNPADRLRPLPPNNYPSVIGGPAWEYDAKTRQFYLHLFGVKQPDLNWDNPKTREDFFSVMRFWLSRGVEGFALDDIPFVSKPTDLAELNDEQLKEPLRVWTNGPHRDEYLRQLNREVLSKYNALALTEANGIDISEQTDLINDSRHELNLIFNYDAARVNRGEGFAAKPFNLPQLKAIFDDRARILRKTDWDTLFLSNQHTPRLVSNFGDESLPDYRLRSAKLLELLILTLRGTPFIYQGDELGMTNYPFAKLEEFNDIEVKNANQVKLADARRFSRDSSLTPMQWSSEPNAGFTAPGAKPWFPVNPSFYEINALDESTNAESVLRFTQKAIALRNSHLAFIYGDYQDLDPLHPQVFAYTRTLNQLGKLPQKYLVVLNFSAKPIEYTLPGGVKAGKLLLGNIAATFEAGRTRLSLDSWDARVYTF